MTVKKNYYFQGVLFNTLNKIFKFCDKLGIFSVVKLQIGSQKGHDHILQKFYLHGHVEIKKRKERKKLNNHQNQDNYSKVICEHSYVQKVKIGTGKIE